MTQLTKPQFYDRQGNLTQMASPLYLYKIRFSGVTNGGTTDISAFTLSCLTPIAANVTNLTYKQVMTALQIEQSIIISEKCYYDSNDGGDNTADLVIFHYGVVMFVDFLLSGSVKVQTVYADNNLIVEDVAVEPWN